MEDIKTILILGGYGRTGIEIARLLLRESQHNVWLAGRNLSKATRAAIQLNSEHSEERVTGMQVDASQMKQLIGLFAKCDLVIVVIPITGIGGDVVQAAFDARIDYIDLNANNAKRRLLQKLEPEIRAAGLTFISEAGFVPGAPSLMARYVTAQFDSLEELTIGGLFRGEQVSYGSCLDMIPELGENPTIFRNGSWIKAGLTATKKVDFGQGQGVKLCYPMDLVELRSLPDTLGCREIGFYVSGVNWFFDTLILVWKIFRLYKPQWGIKLGAKLLMWGNEKFTKPPYICSVILTATGVLTGRAKKLKLALEHEDSYLGTAIATVPCVLRLLDGSIGKPGVHMMGHALDPNRYMGDLKRMGMTVSLQELSS